MEPCNQPPRRKCSERKPKSKFLIGGQGNAKQFTVSIASTLRERNALEQLRLGQQEPCRNGGCKENCEREQKFLITPNHIRGHPERSEGPRPRSLDHTLE